MEEIREESVEESTQPDTYEGENMKGTKSCSDRLSLPLRILGAAMIVAVVLAAIYDWKSVMQLFKMLILWVRQEPIKAGCVLVLVYIMLIVCSMPIMFLSIPLGCTFHQAFDGGLSKHEHAQCI